MTSNHTPTRHNDEFWRDFLNGGHSKERLGRVIFKLIRTLRATGCAPRPSPAPVRL